MSGKGWLTKALVALCLVGGAIAAGVAVRVYEESRPREPIRPSQAPTTFPRLSVQLERSGGRLLVTNVGDEPWTSCSVDINAGVRGGSFSRVLEAVAVGERAELGLDTFARADGRRFDPDAESVRVVDVHCETAAGPAHFSGGI